MQNIHLLIKGSQHQFSWGNSWVTSVCLPLAVPHLPTWLDWHLTSVWPLSSLLNSIPSIHSIESLKLAFRYFRCSFPKLYNMFVYHHLKSHFEIYIRQLQVSNTICVHVSKHMWTIPGAGIWSVCILNTYPTWIKLTLVKFQ